MKLYILQELGIEYDDEYYHRPECEGGKPIRAFRVRDNADAERLRLNEERRSDPLDAYEGPITDYYEVVEVEVADEDVVSYAEARDRVKAAVAASREAAKEAFLQESSALFAKYPDLKSFAWRQYTPYFNDGETCRFRANTWDVSINGGGFDGEEDEEGEDVSALIEPVQGFLDPFDEDDLYAMFGDHVTVVVTKDGVTREECDHD